MARPSNRTEKRREIALAFERALAKHGLGGATMVAIAEEAQVAPGLIHHHFVDREDLARELVRSLIGRFRAQLPKIDEPHAYLEAYIDAALALRAREGRTAAKAWVGLFAEAVRSQSVAQVVRQALSKELDGLAKRFVAMGLTPNEAERQAAGVVSCVVGCLVFGAILPGKATGFAAPFVKGLLPKA